MNCQMRKISIYLMLVAMLVLMILGVPVFAGGGNGGGSGGGVSALTIETVSPSDGEANVGVEGKIELVFTNNVVNMSVSENNMTCFKLLDASNKEVAIYVIMGDDQVDPTIKNNITIQSKAPLKENTEYKLVISPELMSKNGITLGTETVLSFTTLKSKSNVSIYTIGMIVVIGLISFTAFKKRKNSAK